MYPVSEIIDNVSEHSNCDVGFVMVQNYPNKECIDLCISDNGISIPGNYEDYGIDFTADADAVQKALQGLSTKGEGRGYGLRTTSNLVCEGLGGFVLLSSREGTVYRQQDRVSTFSSDLWDGTTFIARLYPPSAGFDLYEYLE